MSKEIDISDGQLESIKNFNEFIAIPNKVRAKIHAMLSVFVELNDKLPIDEDKEKQARKVEIASGFRK